MFGGFAGDERRAVLTLYTDAYRIEGVLPTRQRRLTDILNLAEDGFLVLTSATFTALGSEADRHEAEYAQVNLAAVLFAVTSDTVEPVPELRTPKVPETARISIPPFDIVGRIHLFPGRGPREALQELMGRFLPVTEATFWSSRADVPRTSTPMLAVNHALAQILSPYREG
jgi:hypothetical protein